MTKPASTHPKTESITIPASLAEEIRTFHMKELAELEERAHIAENAFAIGSSMKGLMERAGQWTDKLEESFKEANNLYTKAQSELSTMAECHSRIIQGLPLGMRPSPSSDSTEMLEDSDDDDSRPGKTVITIELNSANEALEALPTIVAFASRVAREGNE